MASERARLVLDRCRTGPGALIMSLVQVRTGFGPLSQGAMFCLPAILLPYLWPVIFVLECRRPNGRAFPDDSSIDQWPNDDAMLKAAAISAIFSWMIVLAALAAMPLLEIFTR